MFALQISWHVSYPRKKNQLSPPPTCFSFVSYGEIAILGLGWSFFGWDREKLLQFNEVISSEQETLLLEKWSFWKLEDVGYMTFSKWKHVVRFCFMPWFVTAVGMVMMPLKMTLWYTAEGSCVQRGIIKVCGHNKKCSKSEEML